LVQSSAGATFMSRRMLRVAAAQGLAAVRALCASKAASIGEKLCHLPDQRVIGRSDVEAQASGLGPRQADVVGQVLAERGKLDVIRTDQATGNRDTGHCVSFQWGRRRALTPIRWCRAALR
jgi:hypothetical protein